MPSDPVSQQIFTTGEVARRIFKSPEAVRLYERTGRLPAMRTPGGQRIFREEDVARLEAELLARQKERRGR